MNVASFASGFFRGRPGQIRASVLLLGALLLLEALHHSYEYEVLAPLAALDQPFAVGCVPQSDTGIGLSEAFDPSTSIPADVQEPRENATILILARNSEIHQTIASIKSLEEQWNKWYHYPYVFLNDDSWNSAFETAVREVTTSEVTFAQIPEHMWSWPSHIDQDAARTSWAKMKSQGLPHVDQESYHHMCRFYSGFFYDHTALKAYKYYWRVEPNVQFTCKIPYDPFRAMRESDKVYGYTLALWEIGSTCPSLFRTTADFKAEKEVPTTSLWTSLLESSWAPLPFRHYLMPLLSSRTSSGDKWNHCHFWSNFEIASLDFFRSQEYREFFKRLDDQGGFYMERWGDAPVHSLGLALFARPDQVHYFEDIGYKHPPFQHCPKEGVGCGCTCKQGKEVQRICLNRVREGVGGTMG